MERVARETIENVKIDKTTNSPDRAKILQHGILVGLCNALELAISRNNWNSVRPLTEVISALVVGMRWKWTGNDPRSYLCTT